jgi:hypothetical protein
VPYALPCVCLQVYAERFRHLKAPRKLHWRHTLGLVELSLTVGDSGPIDFKVTPVHAALLLQFADDDSSSSSSSSGNVGAAGPGLQATSPGGVGTPAWSPNPQQQQASAAGAWKTASQLAAALQVPLAVVRRKAMFWVAAGVLLERRGAKGEVVYCRATRLDPSRIGERFMWMGGWVGGYVGFRSEFVCVWRGLLMDGAVRMRYG